MEQSCASSSVWAAAAAALMHSAEAERDMDACSAPCASDQPSSPFLESQLPPQQRQRQLRCSSPDPSFRRRRSTSTCGSSMSLRQQATAASCSMSSAWGSFSSTASSAPFGSQAGLSGLLVGGPSLDATLQRRSLSGRQAQAGASKLLQELAALQHQVQGGQLRPSWPGDTTCLLVPARASSAGKLPRLRGLARAQLKELERRLQRRQAKAEQEVAKLRAALAAQEAAWQSRERQWQAKEQQWSATRSKLQHELAAEHARFEAMQQCFDDADRQVDHLRGDLRRAEAAAASSHEQRELRVLAGVDALNGRLLQQANELACTLQGHTPAAHLPAGSEPGVVAVLAPPPGARHRECLASVQAVKDSGTGTVVAVKRMPCHARDPSLSVQTSSGGHCTHGVPFEYRSSEAAMYMAVTAALGVAAPVPRLLQACVRPAPFVAGGGADATEGAGADAAQRHAAEHDLHEYDVVLVTELGSGDLPSCLQRELKELQAGWRGSADELANEVANVIKGYARGMLEAVIPLHKMNIVLNDIKPEQFVLVHGRICCIDLEAWVVAREVRHGLGPYAPGRHVGTDGFYAPERQLPSDEAYASAKSDVYALAATVDELVEQAVELLPDVPVDDAVGDSALQSLIDAALQDADYARPTAQEALAMLEERHGGSASGSDSNSEEDGAWT